MDDFIIITNMTIRLKESANINTTLQTNVNTDTTTHLHGIDDTYTILDLKGHHQTTCYVDIYTAI